MAATLAAPEPPQQRDEEDDGDESGNKRGHSRLPVEQPQTPDRHRRHRDGEEALQPDHPRPGLGQTIAQHGHERDRHEGQRETEA